MKGPSQTYAEPFQLGLASILFLLAFAAVFIGVLLIVLGSISNLGNVSGGAIILIGPFPIVLGGGPYSFELVELAVILFLVVRRRVQ